ncbi:calcium-binding protein [Waterburya agarophytonicola K14]|uniref:Calcium-binding protein n=1 Tax=Waterburya agarophytonicola KI4 TaxID=2874699 RepID=A0A964FDD1_9CYAN|nr:calcium-binding protein [Waterburya agarophytonicola KI4]
MSTVIGKIDISAFDGDGLLIEGTEGNDVLRGTGGSDLFIAYGGDDVIRAGGGDDSIVGGAGDDLIFGGFGNDVVEAGSGNDTIFGQFGDDCIHGAEGDDFISGGKGKDTIDGGAGSDTMFGGGGQDVFLFDIEDFAAGEVDLISDFHVGQDKIVIDGLGAGDTVAFDPSSNSIVVNGNSVIDLNLVDNFRDPKIEENEDGDYEII